MRNCLKRIGFGSVSEALSKSKGAMLVLLVMLLSTASFAADGDGSFDTAGIEAALDGVKTALYAIGGIIVGVYVIPAAYRFIKSMLH